MSAFDLPKSVLLIAADIHAVVGVAAACQHDGFALYGASSPEEAVRFFAEAVPSLVVLDVSGVASDVVWAWVQDMRCARPTAGLPIILTSRAIDPTAIALALDAGADDYVACNVAASELQARIRAILRRRAPELEGDDIAFGPMTLRPRQRQVLTRARGTLRKIPMGPTEFRLLHFLVTHPETAHSRKAIRCRLWLAEQCVSEQTIDVHVSRLRRALTPFGLQAVVETVPRTGYRLALAKEN